VRDAESHDGINGVQLDLHGLTGGSLSTTFTSGNGNFNFANVPAGSYSVELQAAGYDGSSQDVEVSFGPVIGVQMEMRKVGQSEIGRIVGGSPTVSARELSIPRKAHEAMLKGMQLLYQKEDFQGSLNQFQRAIKAYPNYYEAYAQMGVAYMKLENAASAEQALRKSVAMNDRYVDGYNLLGMLLLNSGRFADMEPVARKAVDLDPNSFQAKYELSRGLFETDRAEEAEPVAEAAAKLSPDNSNIQLMLANIHLKLHKFSLLLDDLNAYLKLNPTGPEAEHARQTRDVLQQELASQNLTPLPRPPDPEP